MYVTTLDRDDFAWLTFAAGIAVGSGNEAAARSLNGIISRIQDVDDQPDQEQPEEVDPDWENGVDGPIPEGVNTQGPSRPQSEFGPGPMPQL